MTHTPSTHYSMQALERFAIALLTAAGMEEEKAVTQAQLLTLTDAMGRRTHGLAMLPLYLTEMAKGNLKPAGEPTVLSARGACMVWDGHYLPGLWLAKKAIDSLTSLVAQHGMAAIAIRRCHHVGSLATIEKMATDKGLIAVVATSDPAGKRMAPFGGTEGLFTPNPMGIGYPGEQAPVLVDISSTITTTSMTRQKFANKELFDHAWLMDANGHATRDPAVLENTKPAGSLLPVGGMEYGHKGYGMSLMVEALTQGLSGHGRMDAPTSWGGNVYIQLMDADFFAGREAFATQMNHISDLCRSNRPIKPEQPVRVPGDQATLLLQLAQVEGLMFAPKPWAALGEWAQKLNVALPSPL